MVDQVTLICIYHEFSNITGNNIAGYNSLVSASAYTTLSISQLNIFNMLMPLM